MTSRITPRVSEDAVLSVQAMDAATTYRRATIAILTVAVLLAACTTTPRDTFRLSESSLEIRKIQTRVYSAADDSAVMSAAASVLQDMGYAIDEVEFSLGLISASKRADATNKWEALGTLTLDSMQCAFTFLIACKGERYGRIDDVQHIRLTLVSIPRTADDVAVRITIQRSIYDKRGRLAEQSTVTDADVYEALFAKLSKAVFLEQHGI